MKTMAVFLSLLLSFDLSVANDLGTENEPIRCDRPAGEHWYLSRLRTPNGKTIGWSRLGSGGRNEWDEHIVDIYESKNGEQLLLDMYHPQYIEIRAPKGYRLVFEWSKHYEYIDEKLHLFGERDPFTGTIDETDEEGQRTLATVEDGIIQGNLKRFYPSGELKASIKYGQKNRPHGKSVRHHEDGSLLVRYTFREGVLHGPFEYHPKEETEDDKKMKGSYRNGKMVTSESEEGQD